MKKNEILCNMCGKIIPMSGISMEDSLHIEKQWGYFSGKDGERHEIHLCEKCYDKWVAAMKIPPFVEEITEIL